ncbi:hypothetical protein IAG44_39975 [Streptomyces roseirectus]|uniref:Uncharacterized protein n=1 Tax=Streptomyces roseirectus TaxID=2768066 RepID=A0A7H0IQC5_9ACTN|nr:hypothetical protein [Streptomyces roseirectus]QNP74991.1 hypothetical protein IAG44_39975 [Streptomyces roseirectus]
MEFTIEITRHVVGYRTPEGFTREGRPCGGEWLDGDFRTIEPPSTTHAVYDEYDAEWWDGDVAAWAVDTINPTGATQPSLCSVGDAVPERAWLSGRYDDPYEGDNRVTEMTVRLTGDWSPQQRADVFHALEDG